MKLHKKTGLILLLVLITLTSLILVINAQNTNQLKPLKENINSNLEEAYSNIEPDNLEEIIVLNSKKSNEDSSGGSSGRGGSSGGGTSVTSLGICGNGITEETEECDDGNNNDHDECTNDCKNKDNNKNKNKDDCDKGIGSPDKECRCNGFEFGIVKYECGESIEKGSHADDYDITLSWNKCNSADWTASPAVDGILSKEATIIYTHDGGTSGTIDKTLKYDISHITFCGNEIPETICGNSEVEVPEQCDLGESNGIQCIPNYGESCTYCSETCEEITLYDGYCGDEIIQETYEQCEVDLDCDDDNIHTIDTCTACSCEHEDIPYCGDNIKQENEECDDSNNEDNDGCSADCKIELCYGILLPPAEPCKSFYCDPADGQIKEDYTNFPLSTPCEADSEECTIDHCDGQGSCVLLEDNCNECCDDEDCPNDIYSNNYCFNDDVYYDFTDYFCLSNECRIDIDRIFVQDCGEDSCEDWNYYCEDNDVYKDRNCYDRGCNAGACYEDEDPEEEYVNTCTYDCVDGTCTQEPGCGDNNLDLGEECDDGNLINGDGCDENCEIEEIICYEDDDCGERECAGGPNYCENNKVYQDFIIYVCINPGQYNSYCTDEIIPWLLQICAYGCNNGVCI